MVVRFVEPNPFGVLDHDDVLPTGETVHSRLRLVPNASGSELTFVVVRRPGVSREDAARLKRRPANHVGNVAPPVAHDARM